MYGVLNPVLYSSIMLRYGGNNPANVTVHNPGVTKPMDIVSEYRLDARQRPIPVFDCKGGESYSVRCPFCYDRSRHLYVSYLYGTKDPAGNEIQLATCFHHCLENPDNRRKLHYDLLESIQGRVVGGTEVPSLNTETTLVQEVGWFDVAPIKELSTNHPLIEYLSKRGYSSDRLSDYNIGYCYDCSDSIAKGRMVIPVTMDGVQIGNQLRKISDQSRGPKYYNYPAFPKGKTLYNYDTASKLPYVVITEGPTDVWRVGAASVCMFGKSMSVFQEERILSTWGDKPIIVLLDPDAEKDAITICKKLITKSPRVARCVLPQGYSDPGDTPVKVLNQCIFESLRTCGYTGDLVINNRKES